MKSRLLPSLLVFLGSAYAFGQCPPRSSSSTETTTESETESSWYSSDSDDSDSESSDESGGWSFGDGEGMKFPFRIGYGQYYSLYTSSRTFENVSGLEIDKSWLSSRPMNVIEFWFRVGKNKKGAYGNYINFRKLGGYESSETIDPPSDIAGEGKHPLTFDFEKKANTFGAGLFFEYSVIGEADDALRITARMDAGITNYTYSARIQYKDTCGCNQVPLSITSESSKAVFTTRLGIGAELDMGPIGIKELIGYEFQGSTNFIAKDQFDSWYGRFDKREYNYSGMPDKERFSIPGDTQSTIKTRTGFLYVGFSVYINLHPYEDL